MVENREVDWALGEAMAFGSLLKEGNYRNPFIILSLYVQIVA